MIFKPIGRQNPIVSDVSMYCNLNRTRFGLIKHAPYSMQQWRRTEAVHTTTAARSNATTNRYFSNDLIKIQVQSSWKSAQFQNPIW